MKTITLLLDGASDRSYEALGFKTPLQYAKTPNLDKIASVSQCGLMTNYKEGISLGTDLAHMILFGYNVDEYPSRSVIDAIGEKVELKEDDIVIRCSFSDVKKENGYLINSRFTHALSDDEINGVSDLLECDIDDYHFKYIHSYDSHGLIVVSGENLSDLVSDSDPFYINQYVMKVEPFENETQEAVKTSNAINKYIRRSYDILNGHEMNIKRKSEDKQVANMILTKWVGKYIKIEQFSERNGLEGLLLGNSKLLQGLSKYIEMDYKEYDTFEEAVMLALHADYDYVHLHTKTPDSASHKKNPMLKVKVLEEIDKVIGALMNFEGLLIVTSDHSTPCSGKMIHSGESVAFMAKGEFIRRDDITSFDEISCSNGSIYLKGEDFMNYIINGTDRGALFHLRQGSIKRNFILKNVNKLL